MMTRRTKLKLNTMSSLALQLCTFVCGFILPKMYLIHYGSEVNGLIASIGQFLAILALADCGVAAVVQASYYQSLADNDLKQISRVYLASERFYQKIAGFLFGYVILLSIVFPRFIDGSFSTWYIVSLIAVLSIGEMAQYLLGLKNIALLNAAQYGFVRYIVSIITLIVNTILCVVLMRSGATIHIVRLASAMVYLIRPIVMDVFIRKKYRIDRTVNISGQPIKQKWSGLAQHISSVILGNTDVVVLTMFASLKDVSIYSVYLLIVNGIKQILFSFMNGIEPLFGDMLAKKDDKLLSTFENVEWLVHNSVSVIFVITGLTIVPFIRVYTKGVSDVNYIVPLFACLLTTAYGIYCIRLPYILLTNAAGHFKQTQVSAIIEAALNVITSVIFVVKYGLIGVAIGTTTAMLYRTLYLAFYTSKKILRRTMTTFYKCICLDLFEIMGIVAIYLLFKQHLKMTTVNYFCWVVMASKISLIAICYAVLMNIAANKQKFFGLFKLSNRKRRQL